MQTVNVRQLKSNPSVALREAKNDLVVVMNRDKPTALLVDLESLDRAMDTDSVRMALAVSLFKQGHLSIGAAARYAGLNLGAMLTYVSGQGIAVVDYPPEEIEQDLANSLAFERK